MDRIIRLQTFDEIKDTYTRYMEYDFPDSELKPFSMIQDMLAKNCYQCYGVYENTELIAYAYFMMSKDGKWILLDYFAIISTNRGQGIGSWVLQHILNYVKKFDGIMIEIERIDQAQNEQEYQIRSRRQNFYLHNGCQMMAAKAEVFGVGFSLLALTEQKLPAEEIYLKEYYAVYQELCTPAQLKNIRIL